MRTNRIAYLMLGITFVISRVMSGQIVLPQQGSINTVAGNGTAGFAGDQGPATSAEINQGGSGIYIDVTGNIWIADANNARIRLVSSSTGAISTFAGNGTVGSSGDGGQAINAELNSPVSIALLPNGDVVFTESGRVRKISQTTGIITTIAGNGTLGSTGDGGPAVNAEVSCASIATDQNSNIYLVCHQTVREISNSTGVIQTVAGNGTGGYSGDGGPATSAELNYPYGVAVDTSGNIYISTVQDCRVRMVNGATGIITTVAGNGARGYSGDGGAATSAKLWDPYGLTVDPFGNLYVADYFNKRVRQINLSSGTISTFAGDGSPTYSGDGGSALSAGMYPTDVKSDGLGDIFIADWNNRVRVVGGPLLTTGIVNPKYIIVGVTYAPPGPSSNVQYSNSTETSSTTSLSSSFTNGNQTIRSTSISGKIPGFAANGTLTGTTSTTYTQGSTQTNSVTINKSNSITDEVTGTPDAFNPVNHDYDIIWLWLNPVVSYSINPSDTRGVIFRGYGYDTTDQPAMDIYPVYAGYLNNDFPIPPSVANILTRSWASGQSWPSGQGPAITPSDYPTILAADPFANSSYNFALNPSASPATTTDGRFTITGGLNGAPAQNFDYVQTLPGNGGAITQSYLASYSASNETSQSSTYTYEQTFGYEQEFTTGLFFLTMSSALSHSNSLSWEYTTNNSFTTTSTQVGTLSITGPTCTGSPCNPAYAGPGEFDVYQDNLFGSFAFIPH